MLSYFQGPQYTKPTRIDGKVVIITGGNAGIGLETAIDLARRGGKIYIGCRDPTRGENAVKEIKERSGSQTIYLLLLDLASFESIREFSKKFHEIETRLDILINNAGLITDKRTLTKDGLENTIGVNHLGHFLLTNLLLDLLKSSAPSRIVILSSSAHTFGSFKKDDLQSEKSYNAWMVYGRSKLANILHTRELARRLEGTGVTANSLHPGAVKTGVLKNTGWFMRAVFYPMQQLFFKDVVSGAQTSIYAAIDPDLETVTGKYFADCKETSVSSAAKDDEMAKWLWDVSEELTKDSALGN